MTYPCPSCGDTQEGFEISKDLSQPQKLLFVFQCQFCNRYFEVRGNKDTFVFYNPEPEKSIIRFTPCVQDHSDS